MDLVSTSIKPPTLSELSNLGNKFALITVDRRFSSKKEGRKK